MDETSYSLMDMEMTNCVRTPKRRTPGLFSNSGNTSVKRRLDDSFEDENVQHRKPEEEDLTNSKWNFSVLIWILLLTIGCVFVLGLYHYFPGYMFLCLTKEFLISFGIVTVCALFINVITKISTNPNKPITTPEIYGNGKERNLGTPYSGTTHQINVKRTFKGDGNEIWSEFIRYFENVAVLNNWNLDHRRRILFTTFRGQAETYAYGLPEEQRNDYEELVKAMDNRFGHKAMKESYVAEAKLRRKKEGESYRDFAQCLEDLYRRAHPESREYVQECSLKTFLDNCSEMENFRLAVRRTRPKTLQEAVTAAMQEDCIRISEKQNKDPRIFTKPRVFQVSQWNDGNNDIDNKRSGVKKTCYRCNSTQHLIRNCPVNSNLKTGSAVEGGTRFDKKQLNSGRPRQ